MNRNVYFILLFLIGLLESLLCQQKEIKGSAEVLILDNNLIKKYEFEAQQAAINNALYEAFGSSVVTNYELLSQTEMKGQSLISASEKRIQFVNTYPNGIWKKELKTPIYTSYKDEKGNWWLRCEVFGLAEQFTVPPVNFIARTLDGEDFIKDETINFISGESGYIYFRSPVKGFICVFYDDFKTVQRCFPYNSMGNEMFPVHAETEYVLFSQNPLGFGTDSLLVDEVEFFTDDELEYNQFYILYTPEQIALPAVNNYTISDQKYTTFKSLTRSDFQKWLQKCRMRNIDLQVKIIGITITRKI